jgi:hypothetical protein
MASGDKSACQHLLTSPAAFEKLHYLFVYKGW